MLPEVMAPLGVAIFPIIRESVMFSGATPPKASCHNCPEAVVHADHDGALPVFPMRHCPVAPSPVPPVAAVRLAKSQPLSVHVWAPAPPLATVRAVSKVTAPVT